MIKLPSWFRLGGLMAFTCLSLALFACSALKKTRSKLSSEEEERLNRYKTEVELGRNMAGRLYQFYGSYGDEELMGYVNQVGSYVASYSDYTERRYMFGILETEVVNAFACPGGYILITVGTIRNARTEAELAMVLGHEIAHVGKQHMFKTLLTMGEKEREKEAEEVEKRSTLPYSTVVRRRPDPAEESELAAFVARYIVSSMGSAFGILKAAKAGMGLILEKGLDKKYEFEADREGVQYAIRAGYEPNAMVRFLKRLADTKKKKGVDMKILEKTHPSLANREKKITALLAQLDASSIVGADGEDRFAARLRALPERTK